MATPQLLQNTVDERPQVKILDLQLDKLDMDGVLEKVEGFIEKGTTHHLMTVNIRFMSLAKSDREFANIINDAHLTVADGMPLVWMSKIMGDSIAQRITGTDLLKEFLKLNHGLP